MPIYAANNPEHMNALMRPKNWLVESILVTILCCLPFGIVGIISAANVNTRFDAGDFEGADKASKEAGKWTKIGFWVGLGCVVLFLLFYFFLFALIFGVAAAGAAGSANY